MTSITGERTSDLRRELVLTAEEDYMDLATAAHIVEEALGLTKEHDVFVYTVSTLRGLLGERFLRAGVPTADGGFKPWGVGATEVQTRIEQEWLPLGRRPALGEIVWFDVTERGLAYFGHPGNRN